MPRLYVKCFCDGQIVEGDRDPSPLGIKNKPTEPQIVGVPRCTRDKNPFAAHGVKTS